MAKMGKGKGMFGSPKATETKGAGPGPSGASRTMVPDSGAFAKRVKPNSNAKKGRNVSSGR